MQAIIWILRFFIVVILVWFAVKNSQPVEINGFPGQLWQAPLAFVLLVVFVAGVVTGLLAWIPTVVRQRREIARLKRASVPPTPALQESAVPGPTPAPGSDIHGI